MATQLSRKYIRECSSYGLTHVGQILRDMIFKSFAPVQNCFNLILQKSQRTKSVTPQFEYIMLESVISGCLAIRICGQIFCVVGVLRNPFSRPLFEICSSTIGAMF